jgi:hypothetical protein
MTSAKCRLPVDLEAPDILSGASNLLPNVPTVPFSSRPSFMSHSEAASIPLREFLQHHYGQWNGVPPQRIGEE